MTSEEIRIDAQLLCGFQLKDVTVFLWVKDATKNIIRDHKLAAPKTTIVFEVEKDEVPKEFTLPEELVFLEKVTFEGERRPLTDGFYECDELGNMVFYHSGAFEITYRYVPEMPQTKNDDIPLPDRYAEYIKYYVAARQRGRVYGQNDTDAKAYDSLFWKYVEDADTSMEMANKRHRRMPARF